eukprot:12925333-Prorocentrum_lima.AAC.1
MCPCVQENNGSAFGGAHPDNLLPFWGEHGCSDMIAMSQAFEFQESSGHIPVFHHIHEIAPMCQALAKAIFCIPLRPEVIAICPHVLRAMPFDHGDGARLGLQPKKRSERFIQAGVCHSGAF